MWPFVSEFARVREIEAYHQTFYDRSYFQHWVRRFDKQRLPGPKLLYVAAHGTAGRIAGLRENINFDTIFKTCRKAKTIHFVHFGSCLFGNEKNLNRLLRKPSNLIWAAGYEKEVDWVDSMSFDLLLWNRLIPDVRRKRGEVKQFQTAVGAFLGESPGLAGNLGFRFHYRRGKKLCALPETE